MNNNEIDNNSLVRELHEAEIVQVVAESYGCHAASIRAGASLAAAQAASKAIDSESASEFEEESEILLNEAKSLLDEDAHTSLQQHIILCSKQD